MENSSINGNSFFEYLQKGFYYPGEDTETFLEDLKSHISFIDNLDKNKWKELKSFIEAVFIAKCEKTRNIKISKKLNKQTPARDKKTNEILLKQTITFLENFSEIYRPYQTVTYSRDGGYDMDFTVSKESINDIANRLQIMLLEIESARGNAYYYRDTMMYDSKSGKCKKAYTHGVLKKGLVRIITKDEATRLTINNSIDSLARELTI